MKSRTVTFYDLPVLDVIYPSTVKIEMTGNMTASGRYTLTIHAKPVTKQVKAMIIKELAAKAGSGTSEKKAKSSRENGAKGGRPRKDE